MDEQINRPESLQPAELGMNAVRPCRISPVKHAAPVVIDQAARRTRLKIFSRRLRTQELVRY
jgi:hypothetical protein